MPWEKSSFTPQNDALRTRLVQLRNQAGLTQRDIASRLGREQSVVARVETGERRLDVIELYWWIEALGLDPAEVFPLIAADLKSAGQETGAGEDTGETT